MKKEIRVYVVEDTGEDDFWSIFDDQERFMELAEEQGTVLSLHGFAQEYNCDRLNTDATYIKFIEVETD